MLCKKVIEYLAILFRFSIRIRNSQTTKYHIVSIEDDLDRKILSLSKEKYCYARDALKARRSIGRQDDIPAEESSLKNQLGK